MRLVAVNIFIGGGYSIDLRPSAKTFSSAIPHCSYRNENVNAET